MKKYLFVYFILFPIIAFGETYEMPNEFLEITERIIEAKKQLDKDIIMRYRLLCSQEERTPAEEFETYAYESITERDCFSVLFNIGIHNLRK